MSNPAIPTADQLAASRLKLWHQSGDRLLTLESLRAWINHVGLVLFVPRAQQLPAPAPSVVEAVLGTPNPAPTLADTEQARTLVMRLVAEGSAVPLNLLGTQGVTGETPDFLCSAAVFSYIFTLRGDKVWKQPPATSGAVKVSPLALAAYELLAARVALSSAELATELGKEVTESAVLRGLTELWSHLRVVPIPQQDGPVLWELMSTRFTKHIKAGANAGQPSALSALISLYLGMAVVSTEEEIETFLSPLAPRSRIRDVVHALMGARQLESIAVDGRTVLHINGDLPTFTTAKAESSEDSAEAESIEVEQIAASTATPEDGTAPGRITKFVPKPRKTGTGFATRFTPRPGTGRPASDTERRPFQKKPFDSSRPSFTKPWDENRPARPASDAEGSSGTPTERPAFRPKPAFRSNPAFRTDGGTRPTFRREEGSAPPRRDFAPRPDSAERPPRKTFSKPGTFGRKREESAGRPSFGAGGDSRPPRRDFSARPPAPNAGPRPAFGGDRDSRPDRPDRPDRPKRPYAGRPSPDRSSGDRPSGNRPGSERRPGPYTPRPSSGGEGFAGRKPYTPRDSGPREGSGSFPPRKPYTPGGSRPPFSGDRGPRTSSDGGEAPRKVFRKFDAPRSDKPRRPRPEGSSSDRPQGEYTSKPGGFAGKKPFARPGSKPPGTFAKFADGNKPFRKPGPGGKKFGPKPSGPTGAYRKRKPEGEA